MNRKQKGLMLLIITIILFASILSTSIVVIESNISQRQSLKVAMDNAHNKIDEREVFFKTYLTNLEQNIRSLHSSRYFQNYIDNPIDTSIIENTFFSFAQSNLAIKQVRYIDGKGIEHIRVERASESAVPVVHTEFDIPDVSSSPGFLNAMNLEPGELWFSPIDLSSDSLDPNSELVPSLRGIYPVFEGGQFDGVLIINYFMQPFLDQFFNAPLYDMILIDNDGKVLYHFNEKNGDHSKSWGNSVTDGYDISQEFPEEYATIMNEDHYHSNTFYSKALNLPIQNGLKLILQLNSAYSNSQDSLVSQGYGLIIGIIVVFSLILAIVLFFIFRKVLFNLDTFQHLNTLFNTSSKIAKIGFWEYSPLTHKIQWNEGAYEIFEIDDINSPVTYEIFLSNLPEDERLKFHDALQDSISNQKEFHYTHKIITRKGSVKYVEERVKHYYNKLNKHIRSIGSLYDITDKYFSERKFQFILENASDGIHIIDRDGNLIYFSNSFAKNLGYTNEEMMGIDVFQWEAALTPEETLETIRGLFEHGRSFETKHRKKDGSIINVQVNAKRIEIEGQSYLYASQRDITDIKEKEKMLQDQQEELTAINEELANNVEEVKTTMHLYESERTKYKTLLELSSDGIFFMDLEGNLIEYSKKSCELLGYTEDEIKNTTVYDWDRDMTLDQWNAIMESFVDHTMEFERIHLRKDGSTYIAHITANKVKIKDAYYIYSSVRDISAMKKVEQELRDSKLRWQFAVEGNKDGLWDWVIDTDEIFFSPQLKSMLGYSEGNTLETIEDIQNLIHPDDFDDMKDALTSYLQGKSTSYSSEYRVKRADGTYLWVRDRAITVEFNDDGSPRRMIGTLTNITEYIEAMNLVRMQTYIDELTQLHNRKAYNERLNEMMEQFHRYGYPFSMLLLDIDHFKAINDSFGHSKGDEVLIQLGQVMKKAVRKNDYTFRIGGEEFVILLTGTRLSSAIYFAEKMLNIVETEITVLDDPNHPVTVSIGAVEATDQDTIDTIFKRADNCLYLAKDNGRNRVESEIDGTKPA